jgi:hypothetical protein
MKDELGVGNRVRILKKRTFNHLMLCGLKEI